MLKDSLGIPKHASESLAPELFAFQFFWVILRGSSDTLKNTTGMVLGSAAIKVFHTRSTSLGLSGGWLIIKLLPPCLKPNHPASSCCNDM